MKKIKIIYLCSIILLTLFSIRVGGAPLKKSSITYEIKPGIIYNVLTDEYFENNDPYNPQNSELVRKYVCYDGKSNNITYNTWIVALPKVKNIKAFRKETLAKNHDSLRLLPNTIVSNRVLAEWKKQKYDASSSYSHKSPKGFSYTTIK